MILATDPRSHFVYGLFLNRRCIYVGQTIDPVRRSANHASRFRRSLGVAPQMRILFSGTIEQTHLQEEQAIRKYKAKGQAVFNTRLNSTTHSRHSGLYMGQCVFCVETGETFDSYKHAAATVGGNSTSLMRAMRDRGGVYMGLRFLYATHAASKYRRKASRMTGRVK